MQQDTEIRLAWSANDEDFTAESLQDLIDQDDDIQLGQIVYVGDVQLHDTGWIDADDVIEMIGDRWYDEGGEYADGGPDIPAEAKAELDGFLTRWQAEHCVASFFKVVNVRQHTITESDLEEAACNRT
ncbi:hypothetical protein [Chromobacterium haemolyticum]|uniref:hypothetical protein n=1 Tax=Chromobacterium haemolyticum TaxID=394935 RepID=UPI0002DC575D|nr:hypothetical protein [Chromobacterium haemolyticum]